MFSSRSKGKKKVVDDEVIGIIDIGSARVSGAVLNSWPKVTNEISLALDWQDTPNWQRFQHGIESALTDVVKKMATGRHKKPEEIYIFLSSPLFIGQTHIIRDNERVPFEITPPYLANLIKKNVPKPETDSLRIENEIMRIKLDGYPTDEPIGQMAREVEIAHWQSEGPANILEHLEELVLKELPKTRVHFHSFAYATYSVFSDLMPDHDWVFLDTGNELTDILVIKNGYLAEHISFPLGKNYLIRSLAKTLKSVPADIESSLNRYAQGKANNVLSARLETALAQTSKEWLDNLSEALAQVLETTILPESIYLFGDEPSDKLFADFIKKADLSSLTASHKPLRVYYAEKPLNQAVDHLSNKSSPTVKNSFLLAEALFCATLKNSRLNLWPFNQLATTMQDIIKTKKSLRDIFPDKASDAEEKEEISFKTSSYEPPRSRRGGGGMSFTSKIFAGLLVLAIVVAIGYALSSNFAKVMVKVTPKQGRLMVSNSYEATKTGENGLKFVLASNVQVQEETTVPANGSESVKTKAKGQIIVYNNSSAKAQALVANTRFQTKDGLIYRIEKQISVPGQTKDDKGELVPGQVEVTVVADQPGENYNLTNADFTIPGFKGSAKFDQFYARSKGAFTGGFIGERPKVSDADLAKAKASLEKNLLTEAGKKLKPQVPDDYVIFDDAIIATFTPEIKSDAAKAGQAQLTLKADVTGILFNKKELASYLAKQQVPDYKNEAVDITNWDTFKFVLANKDSLMGADKINFKLDGTGHLVWLFDEKEMKAKLQQAGASNYKSVFDKDFPMIQEANLIFTPPWIRSIPSDVNKIEVETNISQS